ncbi:MAG TPA: sugar phosphate isomerase/epimerase family protein [Tepidisphaeraceae bacterium]|jgi:sugar phosphate isomerase/epimerase
MKLAVSTYSLSRWRSENKKSLEDSLKWIKSAGVDAVEFAGLDVPDEQAVARSAKLKKFCDKIGLIPVSYCVGAELLVPPAQQKKEIDRLKMHVDAACQLGVPSMRHDVTRGFGEHAKPLKIPSTFASALKHIVPAIRQVTDYAQSQGIKTSLENHGFYMQAADRVEKLIQRVNHPNFRLTIDLGNFLCVADDPVAAVKRLAPYVIMAHAKDFHVRAKKMMPASGWFATPTELALRGAICGHGVIDVPMQLKLLNRAGYDGYLSLEFEGMEEPTQAVRLGLEYLREKMKALA